MMGKLSFRKISIFHRRRQRNQRNQLRKLPGEELTEASPLVAPLISDLNVARAGLFAATILQCFLLLSFLNTIRTARNEELG